MSPASDKKYGKKFSKKIINLVHIKYSTEFTLFGVKEYND